VFEVKKEIPVNVKREALVLPRNALLLVVFFCICCGLGYTTLNRYDPGKAAGTSDAAGYYELMVRGPDRPPADIDQRILIPYLARPLWWLAQGRVGSWDPGWFALLVVNAAFVAATASMTFAISARYCEGSTAMLGSLLFLLNYAVANMDLAGLVDAGEACFLMALVLSLSTERWWHLPLWGVLGTLSKETFLPLATAIAIAGGLHTMGTRHAGGACCGFAGWLRSAS
jgi:hypothetical protein